MNVSHRFVIIAAIFVTSLITANIIAVKIVAIGSVFLPAAIIVFPLGYIFGDILTEVYGYARARYRHEFLSAGVRGSIPVERGKTYTLSCYMRAEKEGMIWNLPLAMGMVMRIG